MWSRSTSGAAELLLALLDDYADRVDADVDEPGRFFDHLRQVGIRGLIAEQLNDHDYAVAPSSRSEAPPQK